MKNYTFLLIIALAVVKPCFIWSQGIVINEIQSSNSITIKDEDGDYSDWIELYNNSSSDINLNGYGLSDKADLPLKWIFPNVTLQPNQFLLVWASGKDRRTIDKPLHTNFKIDKSGNQITLANPSGSIIDNVPATELISDISYGRKPNGTGSFVYFTNCTPNAVNTSVGFNEFLSPPSFSSNSGFFTQGFNLSISSNTPGVTILYTLDGSEPDEANLGGKTYHYKNQYPKNPGDAKGDLISGTFKTFEYSSPIAISDRSSLPNKIASISTTYDYTPYYIPSNPIFKGTVVRAKAIKPGALSSTVISKSYFITPLGDKRFSLPVLSLSIDENKLFDYNEGINVAGIDFDNWRDSHPTLEAPTSGSIANFFRRGVDFEKMANMTYLKNGVELINQNVGIQIHGGSSRVAQDRSFDISARSVYGKDALEAPFFDNKTYNSYSRLVLHNSGNDYDQTTFRDAFCQELISSLNLITKGYQPSIIFINGEYWGILSLRDKIDNDFFLRVCNIPKNEIDLLEEKYQIMEGDRTDYLDMVNYLNTHSLTNQTEYDYITTQLDPENFKDYFISNIFLGNGDWPMNNILYWRKKTSSYQPNSPYGHDGRWRWIPHDMDDTFDLKKDNIDNNTLAMATDPIGTDYPNPAWSTLILRRLLENNTFKIEFINRFADLLNTTFLTSRTLSKINEMSAVLYPEMPEHFSRWKVPSDFNDWNYFLNEEKDFLTQRPAIQRNHIRSKFGIKSNINAVLDVSDVNAGYIKINTINIKEGTDGITSNPYPWTGIYFSDIPIKLKAIAKMGYVFDHWTGTSSSTLDEITITPGDNISITAVFKKDTTEYIEPIYFWMMDTSITNGEQLTYLNSTFHPYSNGIIKYQSCIEGYPFPPTDVNNYGKASLERRNLPTDINYRPDANNGNPYDQNITRGLQIKEPLQKNGLENIMILEIPTTGFKNNKLSFAAINEATNATNIVVDYSINSGTSNWITNGLQTYTFPLDNNYKLLEIDFSSINATENNPNFKVRLRFSGTNMTADTGARITFNNIALDGVKMPFYYASPNSFTVGNIISPLLPTTSLSLTDFSISPNLPSGLSINSITGEILGTPITNSGLIIYTVTAKSEGNIFSSNLIISVGDNAPIDLSYTSPNVFIKNQAIINLTPNYNGGIPTNFTVAPQLPDGLTLNQTTGMISGTPTQISPETNYTITAANSVGSSDFSISITVNDIPPTNLSYNSPNVFTKGIVIENLTPTVTGGIVVNYAIAPELPSGLNFNSNSGVISGIPSETSETKTYNITAQNSGGNTSFDILITVQNNLSILKNDLKEVRIYPNPFSDKIRITGFDQPFLYQLFSIEGKLIKSELNSSEEIELSELANGVYLLELSLDEFSIMKKIIKNR